MIDRINTDLDEAERLCRIEALLNNHSKGRQKTMLETHAQTIVVFILLGVMSWVGYSVLETNVSMEVLKNDVSHMKESLDKATSTHVNINEYRISKENMQKDLSDTKARLRLLEQSNGHTLHK